MVDLRLESLVLFDLFGGLWAVGWRESGNRFSRLIVVAQMDVDLPATRAALAATRAAAVNFMAEEVFLLAGWE